MSESEARGLMREHAATTGTGKVELVGVVLDGQIPTQVSVAQPQRRESAKRETSRHGELDPYAAKIRLAAREARNDVGRFCEFLDERQVPTPEDWKVRRWVDAYADQDRYGSAIRGYKRRYSRAA
jgi:hypothetical protein